MIWLNVREVSVLSGKALSTIKKNVYSDKYKSSYINGRGRGGKSPTNST